MASHHYLELLNPTLPRPMRLLPSFVVLLLLPLSAAAGAPATAGAVSGRVQHAVTGQYLPNARVTLRGAEQAVFTDDAGI